MVRNRLTWFGLALAAVAAVVFAAVIGVGPTASGTGSGGGAGAGNGTAVRLASSVSGVPAASGARPISGISTHYVLQGLPNCSYRKLPANRLFVALSPAEYHGAAACGGYLRVTSPRGSVTVEVIDQCPECAKGHIDLSEPAFAKLAPLVAGLIKVHYTYLVNPPLAGPVQLEVKQGSNPWWLALLAQNTGNPLKSVQVRPRGSGRWLSLSRASYNYWIAQSGAGSGPFTVRLTDTAGHVVTIGNIRLRPGAIQTTRTYMYGR